MPCSCWFLSSQENLKIVILVHSQTWQTRPCRALRHCWWPFTPRRAGRKCCYLPRKGCYLAGSEAYAGPWETSTQHEREPGGYRHGKVSLRWWCVAGAAANHPANWRLESKVKVAKAGPEENRAGWRKGRSHFALGREKPGCPANMPVQLLVHRLAILLLIHFSTTPEQKLELSPFSMPKQVMVNNNPDCSHRRFPNFPLAVIGSRVVLPAPLQKTPLSWPGWSFHPPAAGQQKTWAQHLLLSLGTTGIRAQASSSSNSAEQSIQQPNPICWSEPVLRTPDFPIITQRLYLWQCGKKRNVLSVTYLDIFFSGGLAYADRETPFDNWFVATVNPPGLQWTLRVDDAWAAKITRENESKQGKQRGFCRLSGLSSSSWREK